MSKNERYQPLIDGGGGRRVAPSSGTNFSLNLIILLDYNPNAIPANIQIAENHFVKRFLI